MELMSPKNDFVFKRIFGTEENKDILLDFLNATLRLPEQEQLSEVTILNPNLEKRHRKDKKPLLDIHARTTGGVQINIEIQMFNEGNMDKRTLYYWSRLFTEQLPEGKQYDELSKTITINILDFVYLREVLKYHSVFFLLEGETYVKLTDLLEIHFIELPKLELHNFPTDDPLVKWLLFLKGVRYESLEVYGMADPKVRKAAGVLEVLSYDREARMLYEMRQKAIRDEASRIYNAEVRGSLEGTRNVICKVLEAKFGSDSQPLQEVIREVTEQDKLDQVVVGIATANSLQEATQILKEKLKSYPR